MNSIRLIAPILVALLLTGCQAMLGPKERSNAEMQGMTINDLLNDVSRAREWGCDPAYFTKLADYTSLRMVRDYEFRNIPPRHGFLASALEGQVMNGMNDREVILAWGFPLQREDNTSPYGATSMWHYGARREWRSACVSFRDGQVSWWNVESQRR